MQGCSSNKEFEKPEKLSDMKMVALSSKDISKCISNWLTYLQMVSGLCNAGSRLSDSLEILALDANNKLKMTECRSMWEELMKASTVASCNVKSHILTALYSLMNNPVNDFQYSSQVILSSIKAFINLQFELCAACCECLSPIAGCSCPSSGEMSQKHKSDCSFALIKHCFHRLLSLPASTVSQNNIKISTNFNISSSKKSRRRWSEAAAQEAFSGGDPDSTMRRWSMPWETSKLSDQSSIWSEFGLHSQFKLTDSVCSSQDKNYLMTSESVCHSSVASQEELQEVIKLLSCPVPDNTSNHSVPKAHLPGVTLTACNLNVSSQERWSESTTPGSRRGSHSPHRTSWAIPDLIFHNWSENISGADCNYELNPAILASRKSSSSTDSSSSHSLHSRSTTGSLSAASGSSESGGFEVRNNIYSIWTGADLPFIKLPETNEPIKESVKETQSTSEPWHALYSSKYLVVSCGGNKSNFKKKALRRGSF